jgi:ribokinase
LNDKRFDVVAVGGTDVDLVITVDELPELGEKVLGRHVGWLAGGTVANFAAAAGRLGLRVASFCTVGGDDVGQLVVDDFHRYGVSTEFVTGRDDVKTHYCVILVTPSGERSIVVVPMFDEGFDPEESRRALSQARAMYMMTNRANRFVEMAQLARESGALVMIDVETTLGADRATLERILPWVDIASFNESGLIASSGEAPTIEGARRLLDYGPQVVVVTLGSRGALAVSQDEEAQVGGFPVTVRDTTGAGDTFNAAFLAGTLRGDPLEERVAFANATASLSVTGLGPRGHLPTRDEVDAFMRGHYV